MSKSARDRKPPSGYQLHAFSTQCVRGRSTAVDLLVPTPVKLAIERQADQKREQQLAVELAELERNIAQADAEKAEQSEAADAKTSETPLKPLPLVPGLDYDPKKRHPIYAVDAPDRLLAKVGLSTPDKEIRKRDEGIGKKLNAATVLRQIAAPDDALAALHTLRQNHPHFAEVIDLIQGQLLLAERTERAPRIPPILLDGEPSLGKTHFATELAKVLGTSVKHIAFDSPISSATLLGSERRWANTQYGALFELICLGDYANPIVILDEIDKTGGHRDWDPLAPLHTLLEPSTACRARDISVDFEFDTSMVTWIATSNLKSKLPQSLRSRFREFHIARPTAAMAIQSAKAVIAKTFAGMQLLQFEPPGKSMAVRLAHLTAREIRQALEQALACAVTGGRHSVGLEDLPLSVRHEDGYPPNGDDKNWLH